MKKIIYISILIFVSCNKQKTEIVEEFGNGNPKIVKIFPNSNDLDSYNYYEYFENGLISFEGFITNGCFKGIKKAYYENGHPMEICHLTDSALTDNCCPDGFYELFYKNGKIKNTYYKKDGLFNGEVLIYDTLGNIIAEYKKINNLKHGIYKTFYKNGEIESIKTYSNDTIVGTVYYFNELGDSLKRHNTRNGKIDFPIKYWNDNRNSLSGEYFNDNKKKIKWTWRDSLNIIIKTEVVEAINGKIIIPDY